LFNGVVKYIPTPFGGATQNSQQLLATITPSVTVITYKPKNPLTLIGSITGIFPLFMLIGNKLSAKIDVCKKRGKEDEIAMKKIDLYFFIFIRIVKMESQYTIKGDTIIFDEYFNDKLNDKILQKLKKVKKIIFNDCFNESIKKIPKNITCIHFGFEFNNSVEYLPQNIEELQFGRNFDQPLNNLPKNLKKLIFPSDTVLDNLPHNLIQLVLDENYDQPLDFLPTGLKSILFETYSIFSHPLNNLPNTLTLIEIPLKYQFEIDNLPDSLEEVRIGVKKYNIFYRLECDITNKENNFDKKIRKFPANLKKLYIFSDYLFLDDLKEKLGNILHIVPS